MKMVYFSACLSKTVGFFGMKIAGFWIVNFRLFLKFDGCS